MNDSKSMIIAITRDIIIRYWYPGPEPKTIGKGPMNITPPTVD